MTATSAVPHRHTGCTTASIPRGTLCQGPLLVPLDTARVSAPGSSQSCVSASIPSPGPALHPSCCCIPSPGLPSCRGSASEKGGPWESANRNPSGHSSPRPSVASANANCCPVLPAASIAHLACCVQAAKQTRHTYTAMNSGSHFHTRSGRHLYISWVVAAAHSPLRQMMGCGVGHMVENHADEDRGSPPLPWGLKPIS